MAVRECIARGERASRHIVQFFDSDESRAEYVAAFLAEGYRAGEPLLVIARPANWAATVDQLEARGVPVQKAISHGALFVKDAGDTLRRLSRDGSPDAAAFDATITKLVTPLVRRGRIRAYGEMVDMLAQRVELADAIKLEELWNGLADRVSLYLMCGYSAAHFVATGTHAAMREICRSHTHVHGTEQDPLALWLLKGIEAHPSEEAPAPLT
jgi:MEDS: MEthanogen/methylotroph, DcmR Sensory domain